MNVALTRRLICNSTEINTLKNSLSGTKAHIDPSLNLRTYPSTWIGMTEINLRYRKPHGSPLLIVFLLNQLYLGQDCAQNEVLKFGNALEFPRWPEGSAKCTSIPLP